MKRNKTEQVGDVIRRLLRQEGLEAPLNEYRLIEAWKEVVGEIIARYTRQLYIKNHYLHTYENWEKWKSIAFMEDAVLINGFACAFCNGIGG